MLGHLPLMTTFGNGQSEKSVMVKYLIISDVSPYNIVIGRPSFNALGEMLSILYLTLKYPFKDGRVGIIKGDQEIARKCYEDSLKLKKRSHVNESVKNDQVILNIV